MQDGNLHTDDGKPIKRKGFIKWTRWKRLEKSMLG